MIGFVANHEDFVKACPENSTIKQRHQACQQLIEQHTDNFKRVDFHTDMHQSRKSLYLFYKEYDCNCKIHSNKLFLCSYTYRRPPKYICNWQAYEYAKVLSNIKEFENKEDAVEWIRNARDQKLRLNGAVNEIAWNDSMNHCYMPEDEAVQAVKDFETPHL